jgi:hypothetical protein
VRLRKTGLIARVRLKISGTAVFPAFDRGP